MDVRIEQAYYGESEGGHRLLTASSPKDPIFRALAATTDHLSAPEQGLSWSPYLSGYALQDRYIVSRTFPGPVTTRAGWAFTHVLVLPLVAAADLSDIGAVLRLLATHARVTDAVSLAVPKPGAPTFPPPSARVGAAVKALLERRAGTRPIVWLGQDGIEDLLMRVWAGLWPVARSAFAFRTAFRPDDADRTDTPIFATPILQRGRWAGFTVVRLDAAHRDLTPAEATLAGVVSPFVERIAPLAPTNPSIEVLRQIESVDEALRSPSPLAAAETRMLVRRLAAISPEPEHAPTVKAAALRQLVDAIATTEGAFIHRLRNLDPAPFGSAFDAVGDAVASWTRSHLPGAETDVAKWLTTPVSEGLEWWRAAVVSGVRARLKDESDTSARILWRLWRKCPAVVTVTAGLPEVRALANRLPGTAPKALTRELVEPVLRTARDNGWAGLYATAATAALPVATVLDDLARIFAVLPADALQVVALRVPAHEVVRTVGARDDQLFDAWTGELIAANPSLRAEIHPRTERGRALWLQSSSSPADVWTGIDDVCEWRDAVLSAAGEREPDATQLLRVIAGTPAADLSGTPWESRAWSFLPKAVLADYLQATARGWIARFRSDPEGTPHPAAPLRDQVIREPLLLSARPADAEDDLAAGLTALELLAPAEEALSRWLRDNESLLPRLRILDADRLGRLVRTRGWRDAAHAVFKARSRAPVLATALHHCSDLLSALERLRLMVEGRGSSAVPRDEWYRLLHSFLADHLTRGPAHDGVWERAGGKLSQIHGRSASEEWWNALQLIESSTARGQITLDRLLWVLTEEYPKNEHLQLLRSTAPHD